MDAESTIEKRFAEYETLCEKAAEAIAEYERLELMRKPILAALMKGSSQNAISGQERDAYSDQKYIDHVQAMSNASFERELATGKKKLFEARLEVWRTRRADRRVEIQQR